MVKSMTGFGRGEKITQDYKVAIEIKTVNHRYCDMNIKLPKKFNAFEGNMRNILKEYVSRGKIDVYVSFSNYADNDIEIHYHESVAADYVSAVRQAVDTFGIAGGLNGVKLVCLPEVVTLEERESDAGQIYPDIEEALRMAGSELKAARTAEGAHLKKDILDKLCRVEELVSYVEQRSPEVMVQYREKIEKKVQELLGDRKVDEAVLATELTIYADKTCVDEETVRLQSHVNAMRETLEKDEPIGRKLDFLAQEMNREANTILSKANDSELSANAIELKTEIEKIREQIQNIE